MALSETISSSARFLRVFLPVLAVALVFVIIIPRLNANGLSHEFKVLEIPYGDGMTTTATSNVRRRAVNSVNGSVIGTTSNTGIDSTRRLELDVSDIQGRVVGGTDVQGFEFPFFVHWAKSCGGSLIWEDIVITAAHCGVLKGTELRIGATQRNSCDGPRCVVRTLQSSRIHPDYIEGRFVNDYMVLKLDAKVDHVNPVKLNPNPAIPANDATATVVGFGSIHARMDFDATYSMSNPDNSSLTDDIIERGDDIETRSATPQVLQQADLGIISHETCRGIFGGYIREPSMICAGFLAGEIDACHGDSGGPLLVKKNNQWEQVGIVSFGVGCARKNRPGVYSRISGAYDWIQEQICDLSDNPPSSCRKPTSSPTKSPTGSPTKSPTKSPVSDSKTLPSNGGNFFFDFSGVSLTSEDDEESDRISVATDNLSESNIDNSSNNLFELEQVEVQTEEISNWEYTDILPEGISLSSGED